MTSLCPVPYMGLRVSCSLTVHSGFRVCHLPEYPCPLPPGSRADELGAWDLRLEETLEN